MKMKMQIEPGSEPEPARIDLPLTVGEIVEIYRALRLRHATLRELRAMTAAHVTEQLLSDFAATVHSHAPECLHPDDE